MISRGTLTIGEHDMAKQFKGRNDVHLGVLISCLRKPEAFLLLRSSMPKPSKHLPWA